MNWRLIHKTELINNSTTDPVLKPMPLWVSFMFFGIPTVVFIIATHLGISVLSEKTGILSILSWFINGGLFVFMPLFIISLAAYSREGNTFSLNRFKNRFRLKSLSRQDWYWTIGSIIFILSMTGFIIFTVDWLSRATGLFAPLSTSPSFIEFEKLEKDQYWVFLVWLPFFFFNIIGEELLWRGYILPRQELAHGKWAWVIHSLLWLMFHACFGWHMIIILLPILICLPFVVQRQQNTWIGIIVHGAINGFGFISVSFGLM